MPRIIEAVRDCSIYLYESVEDANAGKRTGGSGFLFGMSMDSGADTIYAVSNWHVVRHAPVIRLNTTDAAFDVMPLATSDWHRHPDLQTDLAVAPIDFDPSKYQMRVVGYDQLLTRAWIDKFSVGIGDDLIVVGRFIDHDGVQRNQPTIRFGAIAQMPSEPIETEIGRQDAFLADLRSISGYSGSPVFALIPRHRDATLSLKERLVAPIGGIGGSERFLLIGVDCGHIPYWDQTIYAEVRDKSGKKELRNTNLWVSVNTGIAIVVGAWKLDELLRTGEPKKMREEENQRRKKSVFHTRLDSATQKTHAPKEEDRIDVPIPTRGQFERDLAKATRKRDKK